MGVGLRPTWNTSFQLGLKLIQRKKVGGQSAVCGNTGRALNNSRGRHLHHSLQNAPPAAVQHGGPGDEAEAGD